MLAVCVMSRSSADCTGNWLQRKTVPSHMLNQAEQARDAATKQASACLTEATTAKNHLATAASEAATAKAEAATASAKAATASKQATAATARLKKVPCKAALAKFIW